MSSPTDTRVTGRDRSAARANRPSSSAESVSAEEVRLAAARFPGGSTTSGSASTPQRTGARVLSQPSSPTDDDEEEEGDSDVFESHPETESEDDDEDEDESSEEAENYEDDADVDTEEDSRSEWDKQPHADVNNNDSQTSALQEFNRVTAQILDRLEQSERRTHKLERQIRDSQQQPPRLPTFTPAGVRLRSPPPVQRVGEPNLPQLQPPSHFALPRPVTGPTTPPRPTPAAPTAIPRSSAGDDRQTDRVWDRWGWDAATDQPHTDESQAAAATATLPPGERPEDLRRDPFLKMKAQASLNRPGETEPPNSGRNTKSGLVRTATDVVKYIIPWPHHVVYRAGKPVAYDALTPWEFVFGFLACVRSMDQSSLVINTMMRHLYNFAYAATRQDWPTMRTAFQQIFIEIEAGRLNWTDFAPINTILEQAKFEMVAKSQTEAKPQPKPAGRQDASTGNTRRKIRTCNRYQKGTCPDTQGHHTGRYFYHHTCSACNKATGELAYHPAQSCTKYPQTQGLNTSISSPPEAKNSGGAAGRF